jgi:hypothetical protein
LVEVVGRLDRMRVGYCWPTHSQRPKPPDGLPEIILRRTDAGDGAGAAEGGNVGATDGGDPAGEGVGTGGTDGGIDGVTDGGSGSLSVFWDSFALLGTKSGDFWKRGFILKYLGEEGVF